jgi:hypothetical protein
MEEKKKKVEEALSKQDLIECLSVDAVNHKPHPYMIGPRHVGYASDHGGMLSPEVILAGEKENKCKCATPKCNLPYEEHTSDTVAFIKLLRNGTGDEANAIMKQLFEDIGTHLIDGVTFVETAEKFRIKGQDADGEDTQED